MHIVLANTNVLSVQKNHDDRPLYLFLYDFYSLFFQLNFEDKWFIDMLRSVNSCLFEFSNFLSKFWNSFKKISFKTIVCDLENWFIWPVIDGNNDFWIFHASKMLNSSWDATSNVKFRCNNFSCLTNLHFIWTVSWVNCCSRCSNCCITKSWG